MTDWIYGIVVVMVFGTVILQVTPEGTYQKYVRLFLGALLMMTVMRPLFSWMDLSEGSNLFFKQEVLSSWLGGASWENELLGEGWQGSDPWETTMKEQLNRKQESWVRQVLESTAGEYGFSYLDHEVQWDSTGSWLERLVLWVKRATDMESGVTAGGTEVDGASRRTSDVEEISSVERINPVYDSAIGAKKDMDDQVYYEPSELRPLHQALQTVWQLEESQIVLYWQR